MNRCCCFYVNDNHCCNPCCRNLYPCPIFTEEFCPCCGRCSCGGR
ncbi:MAG: hypothetical protein RR140_03935 [Clostridia bacterium]